MSTFCAVDDSALIRLIQGANKRIIYIAPGIYEPVAEALKSRFRESNGIDITVILDPDENVCRIGYGDVKGLQLLNILAEQNGLKVRNQPGLRLGVMLADEEMMVWSPTPRSVEAPPSSTTQQSSDGTVPPLAPNGLLLGMNPGKQVADAITAEGTDSVAGSAEIGNTAVTSDQVQQAETALENNPPAPFDLARKTRVFSSKFQFVELELRGAEWTNREIKLSNLLLNPDVPESLQDLFETRVKPFSHRGDVAIEVPALVQGQIAYNREGDEIIVPMTQADIEKSWKELRERYVRQLRGFGWLIQKAEKNQFEADVEAFETVLKKWVDGFRKEVANQENDLVKRIVDLIKNRAERSQIKDKLKDMEIEAIVLAGIQKLRVTEPCVKIIFKEISWESTRDEEFTEALRKALSTEELAEWFEVFITARERANEKN